VLAPADYHRLWSSIEELAGNPGFTLDLLALETSRLAGDQRITSCCDDEAALNGIPVLRERAVAVSDFV
jgi:hypothetical protein